MKKTPPSRKSGVALLVVIGMLALLMISAVAFTTMMRIERSGASNFRHAITAREMASVAVGRFLGDIDGAHPCDEVVIADDIYPGWTNHAWHIDAGAAADGSANVAETISDIPDEVVFSVNPDRDDATQAHVLTERMMNFVPGYFRPDVANARPEWVPLKADGRVVGRYAYIALNTSGLLDINAVNSNGVDRALGLDSGEIRIDGLPDVKSESAFRTKRDYLGGFTTLEEVAALDDACGLDQENLENFGIFSYIPREEFVPDNLIPGNGEKLARYPKVYVGGDFRSRYNSGKYEYVDVNGNSASMLLKDRVWEILERDDMLGLDFAGCDGSQIGSGENKTNVPNKTDRIQGYLDALFDYIDDDDNPSNLDAPNVENNAMISGISFVYDFGWNPVLNGNGANTMLVSGNSKFAHEILVTVMARNPFGTGTANYSAKVTLTRSGKQPTVALQSLPTGVEPGPLTSAMINSLASTLVPDGTGYSHTVPLTGDGTTASGEFQFAATNRLDTGNTKVGRTGRMVISLDGGYKVDVDVELFHGSVLVDKVQFKDLSFMAEKFNSRLGGSHVIVNRIEMRGLANQDSEWYETFDPRFNWFGAFAGAENMNKVMQWGNGESLKSLYGGSAVWTANVWMEKVLQNPGAIGSGGEGSVNRLFDGLGKRKSGATWKDDLSALVHLPSAKNAPLESVGEMALIPIAPYYTMRLYDHDDADKFNMAPACGFHRLYDFFTMRDPEDDTPLKGLVNPNSRQPDVMTAVYNGMPVDEWLGETSRKKLTLSEAQDIGDRVYRQLGGRAKDISDIGKIDWLTLLSSTDALKAKFTDEARREAVIRNAAGLFATRQQSFLVLIRADAFSTKFGQTSIKQGSVLSTAQAVALVWRDPIADDDGYHPCFVQMLKIITDDEDK